MKFLILLFSLLFIGVNTTAQTLNVVSTSPADGDFGVDTDSIVITFDKKISPALFETDSSDFFFFLTPDDSVEYTGFSLSEDSLSAIFYVELGEDTDFMGIVQHAEGLEGEYLEDPYLFRFTTADTKGQFVVNGTLPPLVLAKALEESEYENIIVVLNTIPIDFFEDSEDGEHCDEEECDADGDELTHSYAAFVDKETGAFSIAGVREGVYFPFGLDFFDDEFEEEEDELFIPEIYFYDPDEDLIPDSIAVNSTDVPTDTLSGILLRELELVPISFSEAIELVTPLIDSLENDPIILGGQTTYAFLDGVDIGDNVEFKSAILQESLNNVRKKFHDDGEEEEDFFDVISFPSGFQFQWVVIGYDAVKDSAFSVIVSPFGSEFSEYVGIDDTDLPDGVLLSDIKPLPDTYIDSDSAAAIIEAEGGADFRDIFEDTFSFWSMDLEALHSYWEFDIDSASALPVMWRGSYEGFGFDLIENEFIEGYFTIFLDIETGEVLFKDSEIGYGGGEESHITFDEAVSIADSLLSELPNDPEIVGGITRYNNYDIQIDDLPKAFASKITSATEDDDFTIEPDGHAYSWEILAYDEVKDSALTINVTEFDVSFGGYVSEKDIDASIEFDSLDVLPFTHIDSDSAAYLIDEAGGEEFRENLEDSDLDWQWEMELQLLHSYWDYPLNPSPSAPITWKASYYAWAYDIENDEEYQDSLTIYLDSESGQVLFTTVSVSNEIDPEAPESFKLDQNYPNPFNPSTKIPFSLSTSSKVEISVYTILGQKVATLTNDLYPAGSHTLTWNAQGFSSGVYIYRMRASGFTQTKKLLLLK